MGEVNIEKLDDPMDVRKGGSLGVPLWLILGEDSLKETDRDEIVFEDKSEQEYCDECGQKLPC